LHEIEQGDKKVPENNQLTHEEQGNIRLPATADRDICANSTPEFSRTSPKSGPKITSLFQELP
jgi:hypothetical protein